MEPVENARPQGAEAKSAGQALDKLATELVKAVDVAPLLHPALEILRAYDAKSKSSLFDTLDVYLLNDCNAQHCGRILFLHRNSLVYRIHRIQEIAGIDLSNPEERSYLRTSFLLWKASQRSAR